MTNIDFAERYYGCKAIWKYWIKHHSATSGIAGHGTILGYDDYRKQVKFQLDGYRYDPDDYHTAEANDLELIVVSDNKPLPLPG